MTTKTNGCNWHRREPNQHFFNSGEETESTQSTPKGCEPSKAMNARYMQRRNQKYSKT